jgi:hypothetical protein
MSTVSARAGWLVAVAMLASCGGGGSAPPSPAPIADNPAPPAAPPPPPPAPPPPTDPLDDAPANKRVGGTSATHATLAAAVASLEPGDVLDVVGGTHAAQVFRNAGRADAPIVVRGVVDAQGRRPLIQGVANNTTVLFDGSHHVVLDNVEISNGPGVAVAAVDSCVRNVAHRVTLRRVWVRDCVNHGVLGADAGGSLTLDRVEVTGSGCSPQRGQTCRNGNEKHPVYVATHPRLFPGARFVMTDSVVRANRTGEAVKTRAQRVELRYNWIDSSGLGWRALGLFGYDGEDASLAEPIHHDIVGNVLIARDQASSVARFGGDGTGDTFGCTRMVHNTVLVDGGLAAARPLIQLSFGLQGFVAFNNLFSTVSVRAAGSPALSMQSAIVREDDTLQWADAGRPKLLMAHNHAPAGSVALRVGGTAYGMGTAPSAPSGRTLRDWIAADDAGLAADQRFDALDLALTAASPMRASGTTDTLGGPCPLPHALRLPSRTAVQPAAIGAVLRIGQARTDAGSAAPAVGASP